MQPIAGYETFDERYVLAAPLASSAPFRRFYAAERGRIKGILHWCKPDGNRPHLNSVPELGLQKVHLERVPALPEDARTCAHELSHAILLSEGAPEVGSTNPRNRHSVGLAYKLNELLDGALIADLLAKHGFDLLQDEYIFKPDTWRTLIARWKTEGEPQNPLDRLEGGLWYLSTVLIYERLTGDPTFDGVLPEYCKMLPKIGRIVQTVNQRIHDTGYETPNHQADILRWIIRHYHVPSVRIVMGMSHELPEGVTYMSLPIQQER